MTSVLLLLLSVRPCLRTLHKALTSTITNYILPSLLFWQDEPSRRFFQALFYALFLTKVPASGCDEILPAQNYTVPATFTFHNAKPDRSSAAAKSLQAYRFGLTATTPLPQQIPSAPFFSLALLSPSFSGTIFLHGLTHIHVKNKTPTGDPSSGFGDEDELEQISLTISSDGGD